MLYSPDFSNATRCASCRRVELGLLAPEPSHQLLSRGQISCTFDEIVTDTPANRLAKAALERAAALLPGQPHYRSLALQMGAAGVRGPSPSLGTASAMQRERLLGRDRKMIAAAELLLSLIIPTTKSGTKLLPLPFLGDHYLRNLFELATYGLYLHRLAPQGWDVKHGKQLYWDISH